MSLGRHWFVMIALLGCAHAEPFSMAAAEEASQSLVLEATIPLKDVSGRIDHLAVDLAHRRLFVAELGNNTVDVIDLDMKQVIQRISGFHEPQGVAYVAGIDTLVVANAKDGSVVFFGGADLSPLGKVELGADADNIRVLSQTDRIVVGFGDGGLAIIDPHSRTKTSEIKLAAHPESFQLTRDEARAFVNVPEAKQVAAVDLKSRRQIAAWPMANIRDNFPMAIDAGDATLAVVFRSPARLALLDTATGAVTAQIETCGDADDVFFDAPRHRIYVSCGDGAVDVLDQAGQSLRQLARVKTATGARTSLFVPELDRLFVAARAGSGSGDAAILVLRPHP